MVGQMSDFTEYNIGSGTYQWVHSLSTTFKRAGAKSLYVADLHTSGTAKARALIKESNLENFEIKLYIYKYYVLPTNPNSLQHANIFGRFVDVDNFYFVSINRNNATNIYLYIAKCVGGAYSTLATDLTVTASDDTWYLFRWRCKTVGTREYHQLSYKADGDPSYIDLFDFSKTIDHSTGYYGMGGGLLHDGPTVGGANYLDDFDVDELVGGS